MENAASITQILLPLSLAFIMFSVGLELTWADFRRLAVQPIDFLVGALSQVVILPLIAFGLLQVWPLEPALAVGVMIIAACPGGVTSNLLTYIARGDTALSVSLTAVMSVLSVITLPIIVSFAIVYFMDSAHAPDISVGSTVLGIFAITTVPVIIGMIVNHLASRFARAFERAARLIATILFIMIIFGAIAAERDNILSHFEQAGPVAVALNLLMMVFALALAKVADLQTRQQTAITLECGLQNGTLAIFVAATLIGSREMMIPGAIYSLVMFPTAIGYVLYAKSMNCRTA